MELPVYRRSESERSSASATRAADNKKKTPMFLKHIGIFLAIAMVMVAYWLHEPVPSDVEEKNTLRSAIAFLKIARVVATVSGMIGMDSPLNAFRGLVQNSYMQIPNDDTMEIIDESFSGVPVRIFKPVQKQNGDEAPKEIPGLMYFHGGGFALMDIDSYHALTYSIAKATGVVVISVDFRRAPEYRFPIPFDDCLTATVHLLRHGPEFGVDITKIAVGGDGTGGNLAAAVVQRLVLETGFPSLKAQVLICPPLQAFDFMTPSMLTRELPGYLTRRNIIEDWLLYFQGNDGGMVEKFLTNDHTGPLLKSSEYGDAVDPSLLPEEFQTQVPRPKKDFGDDDLSDIFEPTLLNPYFCPLLAQRLDKLPPMFMITAEYDILRDDGFMYAKRLSQAGVVVEHKHFEKSFHGFISILGSPSHQEAMELLSKFLQESFK